MNHFQGTTADERYKNEAIQLQRDILNELRLIRERLNHDSKVVQSESVKRKYTKRGA